MCVTSLDAQHRLSGKFVALQAKTSMDEWSVDRICLLRIFQLIGIFPSVDCFSAHFNTVCPTFFHGARAGVNFFMQQLLPDIVYFCCPLVKPIISCCRHLVALGLSVICCFQTGQAQDFGKLFSPKKILTSRGSLILKQNLRNFLLWGKRHCCQVQPGLLGHSSQKD